MRVVRFKKQSATSMVVDGSGSSFANVLQTRSTDAPKLRARVLLGFRVSVS